MFCVKCGNQIQDGTAFCSACGNRVGEVPVASSSVTVMPVEDNVIIKSKKDLN